MKANIAGLAVLLLLLATAAFWLMRSRPATPQIATEQTATQVTEKPAAPAAETEKMQAAGKILSA